jgi:hypothetical protein
MVAHDRNAKPKLAAWLACACMFLLVLHPAEILAQANPFDGKWKVVQHCPPREGVDGAKGYTHYFDVEVVNGELRGAQGTPGEPGWFELRGTIAPDGTAALRRSGLVSNADYAINQAPQGKAYSFRVNAKFEASTGVGQRMSGRPCEFRFSR